VATLENKVPNLERADDAAPYSRRASDILQRAAALQ
jgi:hypothetical protein